MKIAVIGTGYVGLVTGTCFAEMGNDVICVDIDATKIDRLRAGEIPIYEPGLEEMVERNVREGRLIFTTGYKEGLEDATVCFIAVGTPSGEDGSADLQYVLGVARSIGESLNDYLVVVDKSTVPVGTADRVCKTIQAELDVRGVAIDFDVVSNPEFLAEGAAIEDFMRPDRIIVGTESERAASIMHELYAPFARVHEKLIVMGVRDAEMTKYAANAMLATRISFMNEIANICERVGVDVENVRLGIGADPRIGHRFLYAGVGYGGSCFPKDVKALVHIAREAGISPSVLDAVELRNASQKEVLFEKISAHFGGQIKGKVFAVWGLAFKPGTDDMREATSLVLIDALVANGAKIRAFDPVARGTALAALRARGIDDSAVTLVDDQYSALTDAAALVLVTEWKQFRQPDFERIREALHEPVVFDGRNQYDPADMADRDFVYYGIGR
ncbi:MAG: UDP-glucose/GDP-mannose dehydrogenase family protein [Gammaproteobacteria bacterium]